MDFGKRLGWGTFATLVAAAAWACVGDEPSNGDGTGDGGDDASVSSDGGGGSDGGGSSDGATGGDGSSPVDAGFSPASVPGLSLWLQADAITDPSGTIARWPDLSSNHNDAVTDGGGPTLARSVAEFNGHATVTFHNDSTFLRIADVPSMRVDNTGFLLEVVEGHGNLNASGSDKSDAIYSKKGSFGLHTWVIQPPVGSAGLGIVQDIEITVDNGDFSSTTPNRFRIKLDPYPGNDGGTLSMQTNAGATATHAFATLPDIGATGVPAIIGQLENNGDSVSIAEMILVKGPVSNADVNAIETYLATRYGL